MPTRLQHDATCLVRHHDWVMDASRCGVWSLAWRLTKAYLLEYTLAADFRSPDGIPSA